MCHLALEKILKAHVEMEENKFPPKIHNLVKLAERAKLKIPAAFNRIIVELNEASIPTRYPDDLQRSLIVFTKKIQRKSLARNRGGFKMAESASTISRAIKKYVRGLEGVGVQVSQVFLYGSHAKNTAHADSDIDIIIVSDNFAGKNLLERLQLLAKGLRKISDPIEAYGFTPEEVENRERDLSAFWEEIIDTEAIPITDKVVASVKKRKMKRASRRRHVV